MSNEHGNQNPKLVRALRVSLATSSALALVMSLGPAPYDVEQGFFSYPSAHAESSCFLAGTRVRMADGSEKPIEEVLEGEWVLGMNGRPNRVLGIERVPLGSRRLYGFNGSRAFVTAEHPFWTPLGWKSIDPTMTLRETRDLPVETLTIGDDLAIWAGAPGGAVGNAALDIESQPALQFVSLERIQTLEAAADTIVYNLLLDGDHTYFADGYAVHNKGGDGGEGGEGGDGGGDGGEGGDGGGGDGGEGGDGGGGDSGGGGEGGDGGGGDSGGGGEGGESDGGRGGDDNSGSGERGESGDDSSDSGEDGERGDDSSESGERGDRSDSNEDDHENAAEEHGERGDIANEQGRGRGRGRGRGEHASVTEQGERGNSASGLGGDLSPEGGDLSASEEAAAIAGGWK